MDSQVPARTQPVQTPSMAPRVLAGLAVVSLIAIPFVRGDSIGRAIQAAIDSHIHHVPAPPIGWLEALTFAIGFAALALFWRRWVSTLPRFGAVHYDRGPEQPTRTLVGAIIMVSLVDGIAAVFVSPTAVLTWWFALLTALTLIQWAREAQTLRLSRRALDIVRAGPVESPDGAVGAWEGTCSKSDHYTQRIEMEGMGRVEIRTDSAKVMSTVRRVVEARDDTGLTRSRV